MLCYDYFTMSNEQNLTYNQIVRLLDKEVGPLKKQMNSLEIGFTNLYTYMTKEFKEVHNELDTKANKADTDRIYNLLDSYIKRKMTKSKSG